MNWRLTFQLPIVIFFAFLAQHKYATGSQQVHPKDSHDDKYSIKMFPRWRQEIDDSLMQNIFGNCGVRVMDSNEPISANSSNGFLVRRMYPNSKIIKELLSVPSTLFKTDSNMIRVINSRGFNNHSWQYPEYPPWFVPVYHPARNRPMCYKLASKVSDGNIFALYDQLKAVNRSFYIAHIKNAFIQPTGTVGVDCGYFQGDEGCETRYHYGKQWYDNCKKNLKRLNRNLDDFWNPLLPVEERHSMEEGCGEYNDRSRIFLTKEFKVTRQKKVLLATALWDFNFHHFLIDSLGRIIRCIQFLRNNPDVMIHIRSFEDYDKFQAENVVDRQFAKKMRFEIFKLLGISYDRIVTGPVLADEVYIPRCIKCSWASSNNVEIRILSKILFNNARKLANVDPIVKPFLQLKTSKRGIKKSKRNLVLFVRDGGDEDRQWRPELVWSLGEELKQAFAGHEILIVKNRNLTAEYCFACDVLTYANTDIMIGEHGSALSNMMFMPENSLVVELTGYMQMVSWPYCGYNGVFASIFGHHHYIYAYDKLNNETIEVSKVVRDTLDFYNAIKSQDAFKNAIPIKVI